jgi:hypothetical protein
LSKTLSFQEILKLAAFIPSYREGEGQGLWLLFRDGGSEWLSQGLRSLLRQLCSLFAVDHRQARQHYGLLLGQANLVPLALSPFLIFFPVKVQKPVVSGDAAYGYLHLRSVLAVKTDSSPLTFHLEGGHRVTACQKARSVRAHLKSARKLEEILISQLCQSLDSNSHLLLLDPGFTGGRQRFGVVPGAKEQIPGDNSG